MITTVSKLTAAMLDEGQVLVVAKDGEPLAWVRKSKSWWNYDCCKAGSLHWQPCGSLAEVKRWVQLNRGMY